MHFRLHTLFFALLIVLVSAVSQQKRVIISYPDDTPSSVLAEAKSAIVEAVCLYTLYEYMLLYSHFGKGGVIEHEYNLIKAFAAKAPATVLETIRTLESQDKALIEEDQIIGISSDA